MCECHNGHGVLLVSVLLLGVLSAVTSFAQPSAEAIEKRLRVVHKPECVSVGLADFDLLRARFKGLRGAFTLLDGSGGTVAQCEAVETQTFHALTDENVQVIPGACNPNEPAPPAIAALRFPDYAKAETARWGAAARKIEIASAFRQVRCDINYPITGARNNSFIGRQTAHPDVLDRKSLYLSLRSSLFNPTTGEYEMDAKYLAEIPLDKAWLLPALAADGETNVAVPTDLMRVHVGDKKVKSAKLGEIYITGQRPDGLMQLIHSVCQDGDGNIYFAQDSRGCIRLNIRKAEFEPMPVDVFAFLEKHLPPMDALPYPKDKVTARRVDNVSHVHYHNGRIYLSFARDAIFGNSLYLAAVVSIPARHWDDAEKFEAEMRFIGGSWPTAKPALLDRWVEPNEMTRKLMWAIGDGHRLYMVSYHANYFWVVDLAEDGNPKSLRRLDTFEGKKIVGVSLDRLLSDAQGQSLGVTANVKLEDGKSQTVFLPVGAEEFTAARPDKAVPQHPPRPGIIRGEEQYGITTFDKKWLARYLGWDEQAAKSGQVSLYYDALAAMRRDPKRYGFILDKIGGASLTPSYHVVALPDQPGRAIGVGEYGYYQAILDTTGDGPVRKEFLKLDTGNIPSDLALAIGLGPYAHLWHADGEKLYLYYVGYTGLTRMLYSVGGKPLKRFKMESLSRMPLKPVNGEPGSFKWYRELNPGLDGKLIMTGVHEANRAGSPYSNGLLYFDTKKLDAQFKLSEMSRGHSTSQLDWRVVWDGAKGATQEIYIGADYSEVYGYMLPAEKRPANSAPKILVYEDSPPGGVRDRFGFTLAPAAGKGLDHIEHAFAPDQIHLLILIGDGQNVHLASLDVLAGRFADVRRLPGKVISFPRPATALLKTPDDRILVCVHDSPEGTSATFVEVMVDAAGRLTFKPHLTLTAQSPEHLAGSVLAFLPDAQTDGSYDLLIGGPPPSSHGETQVRFIRDFIPSRADL